MLKRKSKFLINGLAMTRRWMDHGLITAERQRGYEQMFGPFPASIAADAIRRIRHRSAADETAFARAFNFGSPQVREWERGRGHPRGPELKLIHLTRKRGLDTISGGAAR